jgi:hypothetical protein
MQLNDRLILANRGPSARLKAVETSGSMISGRDTAYDLESNSQNITDTIWLDPENSFVVIRGASLPAVKVT